jgi:hypothetical protein
VRPRIRRFGGIYLLFGFFQLVGCSITGWVVFFPLAMLCLFIITVFPHGRMPCAPTFAWVVWLLCGFSLTRMRIEYSGYVPCARAFRSLVGKPQPMIAALHRLGGRETAGLPQNMASFGIAGWPELVDTFCHSSEPGRADSRFAVLIPFTDPWSLQPQEPETPL